MIKILSIFLSFSLCWLCSCHRSYNSDELASYTKEYIKENRQTFNDLIISLDSIQINSSFIHIENPLKYDSLVFLQKKERFYVTTSSPIGKKRAAALQGKMSALNIDLIILDSLKNYYIISQRDIWNKNYYALLLILRNQEFIPNTTSLRENEYLKKVEGKYYILKTDSLGAFKKQND